MALEQHAWWQRGVIYQVYPRSFLDTDGDGTGDLPGVVERLDYLAGTLGVDALWLSPFYPSPLADFGYDVADFCAVDPRFGTLADFDRLVAEAHARALRVIVDYVPNHTSDQHPWFQASRASRQSPRRDWYVWRDPQPDGAPPNNWLSTFGGPAWAWDDATGQYYLHSFLKEQPDLNWRNPAVRAAMLDVLRFWLERGVDGFRMDALHFIMKDPDMRDNPPNPEGRGSMHKPMGEYDTQLHLYDKAHPDIHEALREMRRVLDDYSTPEQPRVAIGEMHIYDVQALSRYYGEDLDELHLPFNFGLLLVPWAARAVRDLVDRYEGVLPSGAWPNYVLGNHDEARIVSRVGPDAARLATMLLLTLRGTPTLYYGDELGMQDVPIPPERAQDPWGKQVPGLNLSRDPARTPMQWDDSPNAGFCPPDVEPWLPIAPDYRTVNVRSELDEPRSMLSLARRLLAVRRGSPALAAGSYRPVDGPGVPEACFAYLREADDERVLVLLNFSEAVQTVRLPEMAPVTVLASTGLDIDWSVDPGEVRLRPAEGLVLALSG